MKFVQIDFGTPEYDEAVRLRYKVLREPLGLDFTSEQLAEEYQDYHLAALDDEDRIKGYLLLSPKGKAIVQMRQVAIQQEAQRQGIGKGLVNYCEQWCRAHDIKEIILHARDTAVPFYEKLAYAKQGKPFEEVGIKHYLMNKKL